jgi:hypothetical protein
MVPRSLTRLFAGVTILGVTALILFMLAANMPLLANAPIPDPPRVPCKKQAWPNMDRVCLSWTAPLPAAKESRPTQ